MMWVITHIDFSHRTHYLGSQALPGFATNLVLFNTFAENP